MSLLGWIILGGLAGWLASQLTKGRGSGCLVNIILGIIGGVVGGWLFDLIGIQLGGPVGSFITAVIGATVLIWIFQLFSRR
ncbi:MAG: GlsB/YeaQ/YmgE family stress response membrane protein [Anaerolineae bacterium]|nr:GlsB/YeaQ/YmgE family stress response membrane protein [Anaerolineae bacterium]